MSGRTNEADREGSHMELSRMIVIRRTMMGMSRNDLVAATGLSYPYVAELEKGSKEPSMATLRALVAGLRFDDVRAMFAWGDMLADFLDADPATRGERLATFGLVGGVIDITPASVSFV